MGNRRRTSLKRLYADLKDAPPNVASLEVTDTGVKATFWGQASTSEPRTAAPPGPPPKLIEGTPFPDDGTPISIADLTLSPVAEKREN